VYKPTELNIRARNLIRFHINKYDPIQYTHTKKNVVTLCYEAVRGNIYIAVVNQMFLHYNRGILLTEFHGRDVMTVQFDFYVKMLTEKFKYKCL